MPAFGITGGIACGKSTFRDLLVRRIEAESFDADACVSELLEGDQSVREQVVEKIHPRAYSIERRPDRALLREVIYEDAEKKRLLESILHPLVRDCWLKRAQEAATAKKFFVADIPLLFETNAETRFDRVVTVGCSTVTQLRRLRERPGMTHEISKKIIASQMPISIKISRSDHVIWNDGSLDCLVSQTEFLSRYLHDRYR